MGSYKKSIRERVKKALYHTYTGQEGWLRKEAKKLEIPQDYYKKAYETNMNVVEAGVSICHKKDLVIEQILESKEYDFDNSLFILNPYWHAPLTGILLFVTQKACKVQYCVKGKKGAKDYVVCDEILTKRHRVPIVGLYPKCLNQVEVTLLDAEGEKIATKTLKIKTADLPDRLRNNVNVTQDKGEAYWDFLYVTGGNGGTYTLDEKGNIRHYLRKVSQPYGVFLLDEGKVFFPERHYRRPNRGNCHSVVAHEMDMLGRIHKTICHKQGYHHWGTYKETDGNLLLASSSIDNGYMENIIDELDRETGKVLRTIDMNQLYDKTYITRYDWAHINAFEYLPKEDAIIVCMRNIHTIAKISMARNEIEWMIANPDFYEKTEQRDKVLKPVGDVEWFFQQHGVKVLSNDGNGKYVIMLFDNHVINRRPVDYFDGKKESYVVLYEVDENDYKVKMLKRVSLPLAITRSNGDCDLEKRRIIGACANFVPLLDDYAGKIFEYDYDTDKCIKEFSMRNNYFAVHPIQFNIEALSAPMTQDKKELIIGDLYGTKEIEKLPEDVKNAKFMSQAELNEFRFRIMENVLHVFAKDHDLEKVYFYNNETVYLQDYTDTVQTMEVFKNQSYYLSIPLDGLKQGKYNIAIQYMGNRFKTDYWIQKRK